MRYAIRWFKCKLKPPNQKVKGLIHSGGQISSISDKFAKLLNLEVKKLETLLDLEPTGGGQVPYDGYVEVRLQIPNVQAFDLDVLMLVIPESEYSTRKPVGFMQSCCLVFVGILSTCK